MGAERDPERGQGGWKEPAIADHLRRLQRRLQRLPPDAQPRSLCETLTAETTRLDHPGLPLPLRYRAFALLDRRTENLLHRFDAALSSERLDPAQWQALPALCGSLGSGFATVARELDRVPAYRSMFLPALYLALSHTGRAALYAATLHLPPPVGTLLRMNQLYASAETLGIANTPVTVGSGRLDTLGHAFCRLQLLLLADPYRLEPRETHLLRHLLSPAAELARILPWQSLPSPGSRFLLDLEADRAAHHVDERIPVGPEERLRLLDLTLTGGALRELLRGSSSGYTPTEARLLTEVLERVETTSPRRASREERDIALPGAIGIVSAARWLSGHPASTPFPFRLVDESDGGKQFSLPTGPHAPPSVVGELLVTQNEESGEKAEASVIRWYRHDGENWRIGVERLEGNARAAQLRIVGRGTSCSAVVLGKRKLRCLLVPAGCDLSAGDRILYRVEEVSMAARVEEVRPLSSLVSALHISSLAGEN